jgi:hypothetical protein
VTILILAITSAIAQAADLLTFAAAVDRYGPIGEANPVMRGLYQWAGTPGVAAAKAGIILFGILVAYAMVGARAPLWLPILVLAFGILVGALGATTNLIALAR